LHAGVDMLVGVDGECRVPVTEPLRHDLDGYLGFDEQGAVGVSDVVEWDPGDASSGGDPLEGLRWVTRGLTFLGADRPAP